MHNQADARDNVRKRNDRKAFELKFYVEDQDFETTSRPVS